MASSVGRSLVLAFAASLVLLIVIGLASYRSVQTLIENNERVDHSQAVVAQLQTIDTQIIQIETDARGFLLTGDRVYMDAYDRDRQAIFTKIAEVKVETLDNASHQQKFPVLESAVASRLQLLDEYIQRREVLGATVIPAGQSGEGKRRMDAVKNALTSIVDDERKLLAERLEESRASGRQLLSTLGLSFLGALALICLVFYLALRDIRFRHKNQMALQAARDELEQRVIDRTAELNSLNLELERSNRELQDFAFVASHDLQEPLRKIQAFGDRLRTVQSERLDERGLDYLDRMNRAAGRMHTLINDLLMFSRVATKAKPFLPTDLNSIVSDVIGDLEQRIADTGGSVEVGELPEIDADALQMRQLFQNLIANALKFHRKDEKPKVVVRADRAEEASDGHCRITVEDNGIGFEEKYLDRIFTPFQRLHARNAYEGTGIGLAVCRKIVERHGGTLTAKSTPGVGSTFEITLPYKQGGTDNDR